MKNLRPSHFDFKVKEQNPSYQLWIYKHIDGTTYHLHMVKNSQTKCWSLELEKINDSKHDTLFQKVVVKDNLELCDMLFDAGYPPAILNHQEV